MKEERNEIVEMTRLEVEDNFEAIFLEKRTTQKHIQSDILEVRNKPYKGPLGSEIDQFNGVHASDNELKNSKSEDFPIPL